jgi:hypothetical protein
MILPHVQVDPYAASRPGSEYTVRSLYLDTGRLDFYHEKLSGIRDRVKLRIRGYNDLSPSSPIFLEIKRKIGSAVVKRRSALPQSDVPAFLEQSDVEGYVFAHAHTEETVENAREFLFHVHARALHPVICIVYEREPFFSSLDREVRITLDKNVRAYPAADLDSLVQTDGGIHVMPGYFVFEIKTYSGLPLWLQLILSRLDVRSEAVSKYAICIESLKADGGCQHLWHPWTIQSQGISTHQRD